MPDLSEILIEKGRHLLKALERLSYSYTKVQSLPLDENHFDDETLETWESFAARFARASDIFLSQYLRTYILTTDSGYQGTMRDYLNTAEKLGLIEDAKAWMGIRELRNISAHEYTEHDLVALFKRLLVETPRLLSVRDKIDAT